MTALLRIIVLFIAALTVVTGLCQVVVPAPMLALVGAANEPSMAHLFATVGMFMMIVGGALLQAELGSKGAGPVPLWATLQKAGASAMVALGVVRGVFGTVAWVVAGFDGLSAVLMAAYFMRKRA